MLLHVCRECPHPFSFKLKFLVIIAGVTIDCPLSIVQRVGVNFGGTFLQVTSQKDFDFDFTLQGGFSHSQKLFCTLTTLVNSLHPLIPIILWGVHPLCLGFPLFSSVAFQSHDFLVVLRLSCAIDGPARPVFDYIWQPHWSGVSPKIYTSSFFPRLK